jgi:hypothetical protein
MKRSRNYKQNYEKPLFVLASPSPSGKEKAESVSEFCAVIGSVRLVLAE